MKDTQTEDGRGLAATPCSAIASFDRLVKAATGEPTGAYQLRVGDFVIRTEAWDQVAAEKWLPLIVDAVNNYSPNAKLTHKGGNDDE